MANRRLTTARLVIVHGPWTLGAPTRVVFANDLPIPAPTEAFTSGRTAPVRALPPEAPH